MNKLLLSTILIFTTVPAHGMLTVAKVSKNVPLAAAFAAHHFSTTQAQSDKLNNESKPTTQELCAQIRTINAKNFDLSIANKLKADLAQKKEELHNQIYGLKSEQKTAFVITSVCSSLSFLALATLAKAWPFIIAGDTVSVYMFKLGMWVPMNARVWALMPLGITAFSVGASCSYLRDISQQSKAIQELKHEIIHWETDEQLLNNAITQNLKKQ